MAANSLAASDELQITAPVEGVYAEILTPEAMHFVASLVRAVPRGAGRDSRPPQTRTAKGEIDAGHFPDFVAETADVRFWLNGLWRPSRAI